MVADAFQRLPGVGLMCGIKLFPAVEATGDAGGDLRVFRIEPLDLLGEKSVALGGVEARQIGPEVADQRVHLVRVGDFKRRVCGELLHRRQRVRQAAAGLGGQPFVDDQRLANRCGQRAGRPDRPPSMLPPALIRRAVRYVESDPNGTGSAVGRMATGQSQRAANGGFSCTAGLGLTEGNRELLTDGPGKLRALRRERGVA